ncbi:MAG: hypothetical protein CSA22_06590 [Deltaproteobacteria bacterium]|nr:MAG: hypothetical protein CSA22_06590 [Deltaproteobacteria bacterium]
MIASLETSLTRGYDRFILGYPKTCLLILSLVFIVLGYQATHFKLDASAETLVLENDQDLAYLRQVVARYGEQDYLIITFTPKDGDLFSKTTRKALAVLRDALAAHPSVASVTSMLDVPLLQSPPVPLSELAQNIRNLESEDVDITLAQAEFKNSPLYPNLLVSPDLKTTALQVVFPEDTRYRELLNRRNTLRDASHQRDFSAASAAELAAVSMAFDQYRDQARAKRHNDIADIRAIMDQYREHGDLFLGGVTMIADDMITFVKSDLNIFGIGVLLFLILTLSLIFRRVRWVVLPLICCFSAAIAMMGILGLTGWEVTVISSNFISLQLIITMALTIHLVVRYRELLRETPNADQRDLILRTVRFMVKPCLYAVLTTLAGFGSLVFSNILPIINFGWMMIAGITVSFFIVFTLFPTLLLIIGKQAGSGGGGSRISLTGILARFTDRFGNQVVIVCAVVFIISIIGVKRLEVENCFIDYFKESTEIYQGMRVIDRELGGTTPLDVIVSFSPDGIQTPGETKTAQPAVSSRTDTVPSDPAAADDDLEDGFAEFDDFNEFQTAEDDEKYWFTSDKMEIIRNVHDYLESLSATGKVLSLGTMLAIAETFNEGTPLDTFQLALIYEAIPDAFKNLVLTPYVSIANDEARFSVRIVDSEKSLRRNAFLNQVKTELETKIGLKPGQYKLAGMMVLYNNMLQSLYQSQILTLGFVVLALMIMFLILFRSLKVALIAIFPNLFAIFFVLGFMGWAGLPLDMMTITIAAISVGIAVDNTIHYIHRFKSEIPKDRDYRAAMHRCHESIGHAMYYTSLTIIMGFSILALSNFMPTLYFGLLTSLAMFIALFAALTLLPQLIILVKPFK